MISRTIIELGFKFGYAQRLLGRIAKSGNSFDPTGGNLAEGRSIFKGHYPLVAHAKTLGPACRLGPAHTPISPPTLF